MIEHGIFHFSKNDLKKSYLKFLASIEVDSRRWLEDEFRIIARQISFLKLRKIN